MPRLLGAVNQELERKIEYSHLNDHIGISYRSQSLTFFSVYLPGFPWEWREEGMQSTALTQAFALMLDSPVTLVIINMLYCTLWQNDFLFLQRGATPFKVNG